ncbi:MAG: hypothetical protein QOJ70_1811 [Acidobacteriota bacterium]|jgi:ParB-like chromosome segregation protein Spo0J|nr:hypothetical protein [Acidobacteriota bacterium]
MMSAEEFAALKLDIERNGQREPIWTYQGRIIDGRNRFKACSELNIKPVIREWQGNGSDTSLVSFVLSLNLHRRHLNSSQKAIIALEVEKQLALQAKANMSAGGGDKRGQNGQAGLQIVASPVRSAEQAAAMVGTNRQYVLDAKRMASTAPELIGHISAGVITIPEAKKLAALSPAIRRATLMKLVTGKVKSLKDAQYQARREKRNKVPRNLPRAIDRCQLHVCDIRDAVSRAIISPQSVDAIITDPPYPQSYLPLYGTLAQLAANVLKPGGSLLVLTGRYYLPEIFALMTPHIRYHWTLCYWMPGAHRQVLGRKVIAGWKTVLWFVKGDYSGDWKYDVVRSNAPDKEHHDWQQSESGMSDMVERFTSAGDIILDPFCGAGTTGVVALKLNRQFIGLDVNADVIEHAQERILKVTP